MPDLPTGTVSFLMTDIEGSTRLWEQHPQAMEAALARHDSVAAEIIQEHGGVLVKHRGEGDSLFAVFARAIDAVAAATALQKALVAEIWPAATPLCVRIALHTGDATVRDGDYFGAAVNRCARLRAAAHGGQVLLLAATQELVRDDLRDGAALLDLGEHRLRDLQRPERVFHLLHPDLPADFPPLASLDSLPNNLPLQVTSFVGREKEMAEVKRLLESSRLVTLTGTGGAGKTRLALQVTAELLQEHPDGVWLVELAPLSDPALVPQTVAVAIGVRENPGKPLIQTLVDALKPRRLLLLLDNCEHLLDACATLADALMRGCPDVRILATSREGLNTSGEAPYRWSYDLLSEPERLLLRRLSVFAGGWTLEAAEAACAGESIEVSDVLDVLTTLVEKSLVQYEERDGGARYRLLESVRHYARDRLVEGGMAAIVREHHAAFYLRLVEEACHGTGGGGDSRRIRGMRDPHHRWEGFVRKPLGHRTYPETKAKGDKVR